MVSCPRSGDEEDLLAGTGQGCASLSLMGLLRRGGGCWENMGASWEDYVSVVTGRILYALALRAVRVLIVFWEHGARADHPAPT
jgi:hypothetical protein